MIAGPSETGKTYACLLHLDAIARAYPGAQLAIVRKTRQSMDGTVLQTYLDRVIVKSPDVKVLGGSKPERFLYANGSTVWVGGMDKPDKTLSSERDMIFVNQAEELSEAEWEYLTTRATGRAAHTPFAQVAGDCNPGPATHWIKTRAAQGSLTLLESRHRDNPSLVNPQTGALTPRGVLTMAILNKLTGVRLKRLRDGIWAIAEGAVYEGWDPALHLVEPFRIPSGWRRIRVIDFGYTNPFVCGWIAIDDDGRMYLYRQIYRTQETVSVHSATINQRSAGEYIEATICDHDAEDRATLSENGIANVKAEKAVSVGIQKMQERLKPAGDGKPRLFILKNCLVHADASLIDAKRPFATEQEFEGYVWQKGADGKANKETPVDLDNHGMDMLRYGVMYAEREIATGFVMKAR